MVFALLHKIYLGGGGGGMLNYISKFDWGEVGAGREMSD